MNFDKQKGKNYIRNKHRFTSELRLHIIDHDEIFNQNTTQITVKVKLYHICVDTQLHFIYQFVFSIKCKVLVNYRARLFKRHAVSECKLHYSGS